MKQEGKFTTLTHREAVAYRYFHELLDLGLDIPTATAQIELFGRRTTPYAPAFLAWLAQ